MDKPPLQDLGSETIITYTHKGLAMCLIPVLVDLKEYDAFCAKYTWTTPILDLFWFVCKKFNRGMPIMITSEI